jgi:uncharacterized membrane protein
MNETIVALYDDLERAHAAVQELLDNAFTRNDISVVMSDAARQYYSQYGEAPVMLEDVAKGAGGGALLGGMTGLLVGLAALVVPGVGPVLAAGPIAAALVGTGVGAAAGGIVGVLADLGLRSEHSQAYAEAVRRGGILVAVRGLGEHAGRARAILSRHDPLDLDSHVSSWREQGWDGFDIAAGPHEAQAMQRTADYYRELDLGDEGDDDQSVDLNRPA